MHSNKHENNKIYCIILEEWKTKNLLKEATPSSQFVGGSVLLVFRIPYWFFVQFFVYRFFS